MCLSAFSIQGSVALSACERRIWIACSRVSIKAITRSCLDKACGLMRAFKSLWHKKKSVHLRGTVVAIGLMVEFVGELNVTEAGTGRYVEHAITIVSCHAADIPCLSRIDTLLLRFVVWSCGGLATLWTEPSFLLYWDLYL